MSRAALRRAVDDEQIASKLCEVRSGRCYVLPPPAAQVIAREALELRKQLPKSKRGGLSTRRAGELGIGSGVKRAQDIAAGRRVDASQVDRFFSRFQGKIAQALIDGVPVAKSRALQAADLWGGFPMRDAARRALGKR
jgi:hypothetical protein